MSRIDIISKLTATFPELRHREVEKGLDTILETIISALESGARVELRGFGAFTVRHRQKRLGRNPRTGRTVEIDPTYVPFFRMGKELRSGLNAGSSRENR